MDKPDFRTQLIELFKSSAVIQGTIALSAVITLCYLYANGRSVPDDLLGVVFVVIGYYFGSKTQQKLNKGG